MRVGSVSKEQLVLQNINSTVSPGSLTGVMGPSGSGKTSLLHVVAGMVFANGELQPVPKRLVGFVFQDDLLLARLTVGAVG
jgi:ABC-type sulfate/molybdate transport systems ATPase subunit